MNAIPFYPLEPRAMAKQLEINAMVAELGTVYWMRCLNQDWLRYEPYWYAVMDDKERGYRYCGRDVDTPLEALTALQEYLNWKKLMTTTIPNLEQHRQTGRTSRMLADVYKLIKDTNGKQRALVVFSSSEQMNWARNKVRQDYPDIQGKAIDAVMNDHIAFLTLAQANKYINWDKMKPTDDDQYCDHALFVDHEAIEQKIRTAYNAMVKYDPS